MPNNEYEWKLITAVASSLAMAQCHDVAWVKSIRATRRTPIFWLSLCWNKLATNVIQLMCVRHGTQCDVCSITIRCWNNNVTLNDGTVSRNRCISSCVCHSGELSHTTRIKGMHHVTITLRQRSTAARGSNNEIVKTSEMCGTLA